MSIAPRRHVATRDGHHLRHPLITPDVHHPACTERHRIPCAATLASGISYLELGYASLRAKGAKVTALGAVVERDRLRMLRRRLLE